MRKQIRLVTSAFRSTWWLQCRLVTSNSGHFHVTARSSHLLASKVLLKKENLFQIQVFKLLFFTWRIYLGANSEKVFEHLDRYLNPYWIEGHLEIKLSVQRPSPLDFPGSLTPPPTPSEFPIPSMVGGMDIFWNHAMRVCDLTNHVVAASMLAVSLNTQFWLASDHIKIWFAWIVQQTSNKNNFSLWQTLCMDTHHACSQLYI